MQRLSTRVSSRRVLNSVATLFGNASSTCVVRKQSFTTSSVQVLHKLQKHSIPGNLLKWGLLGFCRTSRFANGFTPLQPKPLDSIIDIERAKDQSTEDLATIWDDAGCLDSGPLVPVLEVGVPCVPVLCHSIVERKWLYNNVYSRHSWSKDSALTLAGLGGLGCLFMKDVHSGLGGGTVWHWGQVTPLPWKPPKYLMPHMIFTGLEDYKARGTQATPYFTVSYYKDFADSKDLVLIRGDVVFTSKLSDAEAKWLLETMQSFYLNDSRYKMVERFNRETREFEFKDVLKALDMPVL
ncbi:hypothetical protein Acr_18g0002970 [Actinidia rufa]|uniref:ATP synthase mitochondrial F1 complex assembly factor 1 n=1 Tax=Actinidia rufa TaxID=165716 RepID=A0A7J0G5T0_9ERIC|nr:hypothetical protein Acr_18g0002970 [Actinidia rufa]